MSFIDITNMRFYAFHGCFDEEQKIGTNFRVDLRLKVNTTQAQRSDSINDTVDYLSVYQTVRQQMEIASHLLEHVADRIASRVLDEYPRVEQVRVCISKLNPPLGGQMDSVSLTIEKERT